MFTLSCWGWGRQESGGAKAGKVVKLIRKPLLTQGVALSSHPKLGTERLRSVSELGLAVLALTLGTSAVSSSGAMGFLSYLLVAKTYHASGEVGFSVRFSGGLADGWKALEKRKEGFKSSSLQRPDQFLVVLTLILPVRKERLREAHSRAKSRLEHRTVLKSDLLTFSITGMPLDHLGYSELQESPKDTPSPYSVSLWFLKTFPQSGLTSQRIHT